MHRTTSTFLFFLSVPLLVWSFVAPEDKEDVFAHTACPAFLIFLNKAHVSGTTVELPCLCKPQEVQTVIWFFKKHLSSWEQVETLTDNHGLTVVDPDSLPHGAGLKGRFSIRMFSLFVFWSRPDDSGIYICGSEKKDFFYAYDLDIQVPSRITFYSPKQRSESDSESLYGTFTKFQNWSMCDRCGRPAEQVRVGLCYVNSLYLHVRYQRPDPTIASCGSGAVLQVFGSISHEGAELEVRNCEEVCPPGHTTLPKDASRMSFLGYSSTSQGVGVKVYHLNHRAETVLRLTCPGAKPNMAVAWDKEDTPIFRREHTAPLGGEVPQISIDIGNHLVFTPARTQDSGICWRNCGCHVPHHYHVFWDCPVIHKYWTEINEALRIFDIDIPFDFKTLYLGWSYYCWLQKKPVAHIRLLVYSHLGRGQSVLTHPDFLPALKMVLMSYAGMTGVFLLILVAKAVILAIKAARKPNHD